MDIPGIRYRVIKHLPAYLLKYGAVDLYQIGRFRLAGHSSTIDHGNALIYPPYYDVSYEPGMGENASEYIQYLSKRLGLDDALVNEVMVEYVTSLRTQLDNAEPVKLEGLGILIRKPDFTVNFESDEAYWGRSAVAELAVAFTPVPRMKDLSKKEEPAIEEVVSPVVQVDEIDRGDVMEQETPVVEETPLDDSAEPDEKALEAMWDEEVAEGVLEPAAVSVNDLFKEQTDLPREPMPEPEATSKNTSAFVAAQDNTRVDTSIISETVSSQQRSNGNRLALPILIGLLLLAVPISYYLFSKKSTSGQQTTERIGVPADRVNQAPTSKAPTEETAVIEDSTEEEVTVDEKKKKSVDETPESVSEHQVSKPQKDDGDKQQIVSNLKQDNVSYASGDCVIVVGAFGSGPNREKMIQKLETKGYRVYVDSARSLSRVGVYASCNRSELQGQLSQIKSEIEASSWILKGR